jgi:1-acyl-sn-glycerol-3-phosphate acyltransferase
MLVLRSALFHVAFYLVTAVVAIGALPLLAGPPRWARAVGSVWSRIVLWLTQHIVGLSYAIEGSLPAGPVVIAAKHQSAFETYLFPALRPETIFVIKRELLRAPLVGLYLSRAGQIAIDRTASASAIRYMVGVAKERLAEGLSIVIFPEGTRVAVGATAPILPGVSALYGQLRLGVVPVTLDSGLYWPRLSFIRRPGTIRVRVGETIPPGLNRRAFEEALRAALQVPLDRPARIGGTAPCGAPS